jgi:hypothetical protein
MNNVVTTTIPTTIKAADSRIISLVTKGVKLKLNVIRHMPYSKYETNTDDYNIFG